MTAPMPADDPNAPSRVSAVIQISPRIEPGTGVGAVAHHLECEFAAHGVTTGRITLSDTGGDWTLRIPGRLGLAAQAVWFSTVGTLVVRRRLARQPDAASICHNDALAGDIYVNHGVVHAAMQARGNTWLRMARNPLHLFTFIRDRARYRSRSMHQMVVNVSAESSRELECAYGTIGPPQVVIGHGVDLDRFRPLSDRERRAARAQAGLTKDDFAVLFIGHEFHRKGLPALIEAINVMDETSHLFVVGGTPEMIASERATAAATRLDSRLHFVGAADPRPWLAITDALALPSAYETGPLVVLEALACGVPVVATPTGMVPDLVSDGVNGYVITADPPSITAALCKLRNADGGQLSKAARREAERHSWRAVSRRYLAVLASLKDHAAPSTHEEGNGTPA